MITMDWIDEEMLVEAELMSVGQAIHLILDIADRFGMRVWCYTTDDVHDCAEDLEVELTEEEAGDILDDIPFDGLSIDDQVRDLIKERHKR